MVDITAPIPEGRQIIHRYGDGGFVINGAEYRSPILVCQTATHALPDMGLADLLQERLSVIKEYVQSDEMVVVLLLGTGERMGPENRGCIKTLREAGLSVDPMDTGAACRTFNVLQAEDRAVSALLIPVP